jgi:transposase
MIRYFFDSGLSISDISDGRNGAPHKIKRQTLSHWINWYRQWDVPPAFNSHLLRVDQGNGSLNEREKAVLKRFVLQNPTLYLDEIQFQLAEQGMPLCSISTLHKYLNKMNLSHRKLLSVARERCEYRRAQYLQEVKQFAPEQLVFVDETQKKLMTAHRNRGWAVRGSHARVLERFTRRRNFTFSMIAAMDMEGFIVEACLPVDKVVGTVTAEVFSEYLRHSLLPNCNAYESGLPRSVIVLDNATVHDPGAVEALCAEFGVRLIWTAPYSPDLNPIEYMFHVYKAHLRRYANIQGEEVAHYQALSGCLDAEGIRRIYQHCHLVERPPLEDATDIVNALIRAGCLEDYY